MYKHAWNSRLFTKYGDLLFTHFNACLIVFIQEAESMSQNWATFHHTNPMTGEPIPELINWSGAPQVDNL